MWAGIIYGSLLERHGDHILLSGGAKIFLLDDAVRCDFRVGTYLKVTYTELDGTKLARGTPHSVPSPPLTPPPGGGPRCQTPAAPRSRGTRLPARPRRLCLRRRRVGVVGRVGRYADIPAHPDAPSQVQLREPRRLHRRNRR